MQKKRIILTDTKRVSVEDYIKSSTLLKNESHYIIDRNGEVIKYKDLKSSLIKDGILETDIVISISNAGYLFEKEGVYTNFLNDIVPENEISNFKWRYSISHWHTYTKKQYPSIKELIIELGKQFNIEIKIFPMFVYEPHNIGLYNVFSESVLNKLSCSVNPNFNFQKII